MPTYDRLCPRPPAPPAIDALISAFCKSSSLRNPPPLHTSCSMLDGMDFPHGPLPDETYGMVTAGADPEAFLAVVIDWAMVTRDLYLFGPAGIRRLIGELPEVTAIALHDADSYAYAFVGSRGVSVGTSRRGTIQIPGSSGLRAIEMHFVDSTTLVAVLVGESQELTLPVRALVTIDMAGETHVTHVTHVDMVGRRSAMAWGCGKLALGGIDGAVHLFDVSGAPKHTRRISRGVGPVSALSFGEEGHVLYIAQGADLHCYYLYYLESNGCANKRLYSTEGAIRFLQGTLYGVVVLVGESSEGAAEMCTPLLVSLDATVHTIHMQSSNLVSQVIDMTGRGAKVAITQTNAANGLFELVLFDVPKVPNTRRPLVLRADPMDLR
jgi:hypothetical protein